MGGERVPQASIYFFFRPVIKRNFSSVCGQGGVRHGGSRDTWFCEELLGYIWYLEGTFKRDQEKKLGLR